MICTTCCLSWTLQRRGLLPGRCGGILIERQRYLFVVKTSSIVEVVLEVNGFLHGSPLLSEVLVVFLWMRPHANIVDILEWECIVKPWLKSDLAKVRCNSTFRHQSLWPRVVVWLTTNIGTRSISLIVESTSLKGILIRNIEFLLGYRCTEYFVSMLLVNGCF